MRDTTIISEMNQLRQLIKLVDDQTKTALAGEMMMQQAMRKVLVNKGICTDKDIANALSEVIEDNNKRAKEIQEKEKKDLVKPTAEETAKVEASKKETEVANAEKTEVPAVAKSPEAKD